MKKLAEFKEVQDALVAVATQSSINHDNGTYGKSYYCHYWGKEEVTDKAKAVLEEKIVKAIYGGHLEQVNELKEELNRLPKGKINMIFKLVEPIRRLKGSKISYGENKTYSPVMENVEYIYISEDNLNLNIAGFEETEDKRDDSQGNPATIIKLILTGAMLDVKEGMLDWKDESKELRSPRAWVTPISFRAMQIVGKVLGTEKKKLRELYSFREND